jgi:hypothetical protein
VNDIPKSVILDGIDALEREEAAHLIAFASVTDMLGRLKDTGGDAAGWVKRQFAEKGGEVAKSSFDLRLEEATNAVLASDTTTLEMKALLWAELFSCLELSRDIPLSKRTGERNCIDLAHAAAVVLGPIVEAEIEQSLAKKLLKKATSVVKGRDPPSFDTLLMRQLQKVSTQSITDGYSADENARNQLAKLQNLSRSVQVETLLNRENASTAGIVALGASAVGASAGVNAAGFSAYIAAAKLSAFVPLVGGKGMVSALFVLANPLVTIPLVLGGGYFLKRSMEQSIKAMFAANMVILLALRGLSHPRTEPGSSTIGFRGISNGSVPKLSGARAVLAEIAATSGIGLPLAVTPMSEAFGQVLKSANTDAFRAILFPDERPPTNDDDTLIVGALTVGDAAYHALMIDTKAVEAADFPRSAEIDDLFKFSAFATSAPEFDDSSLSGFENNLAGYVAERIVAARLTEQGYVVSFPETANFPGADLFVDGEAFQVKCLKSIAGLERHFQKYPDIPVYANAELMDNVAGKAWAGKVFALEGFDYGLTRHIMETSLDAGESLMEINERVPLFAVTLSAARNLHGWWRGAIPLSQVPFDVALGSAIKGGLSIAGGLAGKTFGLVFLGPAGAVIFGGLGGVVSLMGAGTARSQLDKLVAPAWKQSVEENFQKLIASMVSALKQKLDLFHEKRRIFEGKSSIEHLNLRDRLDDDIIWISEGIVRSRVCQTSTDQMEDRIREALRIINDHAVHPIKLQPHLQDVLTLLANRPSLSSVAGEATSQAMSRLNLFKRN